MALYHSTEKGLNELPNLSNPKKLSKILGTDFLLRRIREIPASDIGGFRVGSMVLALGLGSLGYYFYRKYIEQKMATSHSYYKLTQTQPINAGHQFLRTTLDTKISTNTNTLYYRMPEKEFNILYRYRPAYIKGEFDHDKEILIPKGNGYDVITPFYYYNLVSQDINNIQKNYSGQDVPVNNVQNAAIAVHRGW